MLISTTLVLLSLVLLSLVCYYLSCATIYRNIISRAADSECLVLLYLGMLPITDSIIVVLEIDGVGITYFSKVDR